MPQSAVYLPSAVRTLRSVLVPVFLKVEVMAEDGLQAECLAVELLRQLAPKVVMYPPGFESVVSFQSVIAPLSGLG